MNDDINAFNDGNAKENCVDIGEVYGNERCYSYLDGLLIQYFFKEQYGCRFILTRTNNPSVFLS